MKEINSVKEIYDNYNYFIIDLWGVLHDGTSPYPKAVETLKFLKESGKKIALLSNAPRRSHKAAEVLDKLGFMAEYYDLLLTSGEASFQYVSENYGNNNGQKYYYIGPDKDKDILEGSNVEITENASEAQFALVTGFEGFGSVFEEKKNYADEALKAGLKLICANPDRLVVKQTGETQICAGLVGEYYKKQGGEVIYFGKPYQKVYDNIISQFKITDCSKVLCIGDSFHTDIKGANIIGADSLLSAIGIHSQNILNGSDINHIEAEKIAASENAKATYIIKEFS